MGVASLVKARVNDEPASSSKVNALTTGSRGGAGREGSVGGALDPPPPPQPAASNGTQPSTQSSTIGFIRPPSGRSTRAGLLRPACSRSSQRQLRRVVEFRQCPHAVFRFAPVGSIDRNDSGSRAGGTVLARTEPAALSARSGSSLRRSGGPTVMAQCQRDREITRMPVRHRRSATAPASVHPPRVSVHRGSPHGAAVSGVRCRALPRTTRLGIGPSRRTVSDPVRHGAQRAHLPEMLGLASETPPGLAAFFPWGYHPLDFA